MASRTFQNTALLSKFTLEHAGTVAAGASVNINVTLSQTKYFVVNGTWNQARIGFVFPANGGEPRAKLISAYSNSEDATLTDYFSVQANGNWGLTFTNTTSIDQPLVVVAIRR